MPVNPGPTLHGSTIQEIAAERDTLRAQLAQVEKERDEAVQEATNWRAAYEAASAKVLQPLTAEQVKRALHEGRAEAMAAAGDNAWSSLLSQRDAAIARAEAVEKERDEALANYRFMVERAADQKLDGYRDLGARAAAAENERDAAIARAASALHGARERAPCSWLPAPWHAWPPRSAPTAPRSRPSG